MPGAEGRWGWLRSEGLNLAAGLGSALLLAVGSFVLAATHDGASKGVEMDDLRVFFERPSWVHLWLYLLFPTMALWALNTLLCTWDTFWARLRQGARRPSAYASVLVHVSVLLALLAHLVGGVASRETGVVVVTPGGATLPDGRTARLLDLSVDVLPGGMPRAVRARIGLTGPSGAETEETVGYNEPLSAGLGRSLHLLVDQGEEGSRARIRSDAGRCTLGIGESCQVGTYRLRLVQVLEPGQMFPTARARVAVEDLAADSEPRRGETWLNPDTPRDAAGLGGLVLEALERSPWVALRGREAPGNPIAAASAVLMTLGLLAMARRVVGGEVGRREA